MLACQPLVTKRLNLGYSFSQPVLILDTAKLRHLFLQFVLDTFRRLVQSRWTVALQFGDVVHETVIGSQFSVPRSSSGAKVAVPFPHGGWSLFSKEFP